MKLRWTGRTKPYTAAQLIRGMDAGRQDRASDYKVKGYTTSLIIDPVITPATRRTKAKQAVVNIRIDFVVKHQKRGAAAKLHLVTVVMPYNTGDVTELRDYLKKPVKVYSTTGDFKYRFAHILSKTGNLYLPTKEIEKDFKVVLQKPPKVVNPSMLVMIDAATYACLKYLPKVKVKFSKKASESVPMPKLRQYPFRRY